MRFLKEVFTNFTGLLLLIFGVIILVTVWSIAMLGWLVAILIGFVFGIWWGILLLFIWLFSLAIFITLNANT